MSDHEGQVWGRTEKENKEKELILDLTRNLALGKSPGIDKDDPN